MPETSHIPRQSLHDALTPGVRSLILEGDLKPGAKIPERELCARFGVSRTPLRETLKVLAAEGLIELLPQRGAIVAEISEDDIREIFPIMAALEALAGELACDQASEAGIARVKKLHDQMMKAYKLNREAEYLRLNRLVHEAIFALAGNETLTAMYQQILTRLHSHRFIVRKSEASWKSAVEDHEEIMSALAARDKRKLSRILRKHITGTTRAIAKEFLARRAKGAAA